MKALRPACSTGAHWAGFTYFRHNYFFLQLDLFLPESPPLSLQNLVVLILRKTDDMQLCDIQYAYMCNEYSLRVREIEFKN